MMRAGMGRRFAGLLVMRVVRVGVASAESLPVASALSVWRDPAAWAKAADIIAVLIAVSLPWSTTLVAIFTVVWAVTLVPTLRIKSFLHSLTRPKCIFPIALFF